MLFVAYVSDLFGALFPLYTKTFKSFVYVSANTFNMVGYFNCCSFLGYLFAQDIQSIFSFLIRCQAFSSE